MNARANEKNGVIYFISNGHLLKARKHGFLVMTATHAALF